MYHIPANKTSAVRRRLLVKLGFVLLLLMFGVAEFMNTGGIAFLILTAMLLLFAIGEIRSSLAGKEVYTRHDLKQALDGARLEAQRRNAGVTLLDLVVGILQVEDSPVSRTLSTQGITPQRMRDVVDTQPADWLPAEATDGEFSAQASQAIATAGTIAVAHQHRAIGTEHLLLAIIQMDNHAVHLFDHLGVSEEQLGQMLIQLLDVYAE